MKWTKTVFDLAAGDLGLSVVPEIGGGVARLNCRGVPIFRPWDGTSHDPNALGCYPLVPWSNRISGGGIEAGGKVWPLRPNGPAEPYPIHGDGWRKPWRVEHHTADKIVLCLESSDQPPFHYRAELTYTLADDLLTMRLAVEHRGAVPIPYGLGFHPWLPRTRDTLLELPATEIWLETADHMAAGKVPVAERPDWDLAQARPLPAGWINNGFAGLLDTTFWGGIRPCIKAAGVCETFQTGLAVNSSGELGIQLATMLHLGAVLPSLTFAGDAHYHHLADDVIEGGKLAYRDGAIAVPEAPGLGVRLDRDRVERWADHYRRVGGYPYDRDPQRPDWFAVVPNTSWADPLDDRVPSLLP